MNKKKWRKLGILALIACICTPTATVYAEGLTEQKEISVEASNDGSFTVSVPTLKTFEVKDERACTEALDLQTAFYCDASNMAKNKILDICYDDEFVLYRDKTDEEYVANITQCFNLGVMRMQLQQGGSASMYGAKIILPHLPAGAYTGSISMNINIKNRGAILSANDIKKYIEPNEQAEELKIPEMIDGNIYVDGIDIKEMAKTYPNLRCITIPRKEGFVIHDSHGNGGDYEGDETITIDLNDSDAYLNYTAFRVPVILEHPGDKTTYVHLYNRKNEISTKAKLPDSVMPDTGGSCLEDVYELNDDIPYAISGWSHDFYAKKVIINTAKTTMGFSDHDSIEEVIFNAPYITKEAFRDDKNLHTLTIGEAVKYIGPRAFAGCKNLTTVNIPDTVKYIDPSAFAGTPFLEELKKHPDKDGRVMLAGNVMFAGGNNSVVNGVYEYPYEYVASIDLSSVPEEATTLTFAQGFQELPHVNFNGTCTNIRRLDLTNINQVVIENGSTDDDFIAYSKYFPNLTELVTSKNNVIANRKQSTSCWKNLTNIEFNPRLTSIDNFAMNHFSAYSKESLTIPKAVNKIGTGVGCHVFYNLGKDDVFKEFIVEDGNKFYETENGILYSSGKKNLVAIPRAAEFKDNTYVMPNELETMGELSFSKNKNIDTVVLGDSYHIYSDIDDPSIRSTLYSGSLNHGNSLSVAIYAYVPVKTYEVNEGNENYISIDGCIYSKDGKHLLAVPHYYTGELHIAEGCEYIDKNAFWIYAGQLDSQTNHLITKVIIPRTMKFIDSKQMEYLNKKFSYKMESNSPHYPLFSGKISQAAEYSIKPMESETFTVGDNGYTLGRAYWVNVAGTIGFDNSNSVIGLLPISLKSGDYKMTLDYDQSVFTDGLKYKAVCSNPNGTSGTQTAYGATGFSVTQSQNEVYISIQNKSGTVWSNEQKAAFDSIRIKLTKRSDIDTATLSVGQSCRVDKGIVMGRSYWVNASNKTLGMDNNSKTVYSYEPFNLAAGTYHISATNRTLGDGCMFKVISKSAGGTFVKSNNWVDAKNGADIVITEDSSIYVNINNSGNQPIPVDAINSLEEDTELVLQRKN